MRYVARFVSCFDRSFRDSGRCLLSVEQLRDSAIRIGRVFGICRIGLRPLRTKTHKVT